MCPARSKHLIRITAVNRQQPCGYYSQRRDEDTETQGTNWSKPKQGSSRMSLGHPKALTTLLLYNSQRLFSKERSSSSSARDEFIHQASAQAPPPLGEASSIPCTHGPNWVVPLLCAEGTLCFPTPVAHTSQPWCNYNSLGSFCKS